MKYKIHEIIINNKNTWNKQQIINTSWKINPSRQCNTLYREKNLLT